uniref:Wsv226-like protein n=1 Tax=Sesarmops intermedium nimavirus TaxID=2133796 RepID=A0A401IPR6_9VIRU|nr:wsv226-like protein [Sesarmops intermedium nimavirus]
MANPAAASVPDLLSILIQNIIVGGEEENQGNSDGPLSIWCDNSSFPVKQEKFNFGVEEEIENQGNSDGPLPILCDNSSKEEKFSFEDMVTNNDVLSPLDLELVWSEDDGESINGLPRQRNLFTVAAEAPYLPLKIVLPEDDDKSSEFIDGLPHRKSLFRVAADEFGAPYLPDQKSINSVENFWGVDDRKKKYLSHLRGNSFIGYFIDGIIDAKTCVGMLRSIATEYGYRSIYNVAKMATETIAAAKKGRESPPNKHSFCVEAKNLLCGDERLGNVAATVKKPDSLHPLSSLENSEIFRKMKNPTTKGVCLDWSETAAQIDAASCRKVAALTNLICAIIMPAYTFDEVMALSGESERAILRQHAAGGIAKDTKDVVDEMCVLACIHSLVQYFSSSTYHLFSAPLRLPPFDKHPVVNLQGSKFFFPDEKVETNVVATMSAPAHSTFVLNCRNKRRSKVCETTGGITAHVKLRQTKKEVNARRRDPFVHMKKEERPLLTRNVLILSGNYGWFGLTLGHTPSPDILFAENNYDGLFSPGVIRRYRNETIGATPFRNRYLDLRFWGLEITEAMGYTSCFRIRPASLCNSNNMFTADISPGKANNNNNRWTGNVVEGLKNPFVTRMGYPQWYNSKGLGDIFEKVDLKDHVAALDYTMDKFVKLMEGDQRWKANQDEKVSVLKNCITLLVLRLNHLAERMDEEFGEPVSPKTLKKAADDDGEAARSSSSNSRRRQMCNNVESAIIAAVQQHGKMAGEKKRQKILKTKETLADLHTAFKHATSAISVCRMLVDECQKNPERFFDGECRIAAHDLYKYMYRNSARQYIRSSLIRGVKMSVLWRRPYDECADRALAGVPRCRFPQLIVGVENFEEKRRIEGKEELLLPGLQIFNTRDVNPKPMHHILLSMVYGKELAKDISAMNCLEWMKWCTDTVGEKTKEEEFAPLVRKRCLMYNNNRGREYNRKRGREEEEDRTSNIISETIHDESIPVYDIKFPAAASKRGGTKNKEHEEDEAVGEEEEEKMSSPEAFAWPRKKKAVWKKLHTTNKMRTGRLGYKDVYIVALTSLPQKLSNEVSNVANDMGFQIPNL